jgi:hypothetical protein
MHAYVGGGPCLSLVLARYTPIRLRGGSNMANSKTTQIHDIGELCEDLVEHVEEGEQAEAIATAELILRKVREYFGTPS